jgi:Coenzyme PQQ synthesis protein D (PqqD)
LEECVIYDVRQKKAHHLNSTLTWIWRRCDGNTNIEALADSFAREFHVKDGLPILITGLEQLEARNLLNTSVDLNLLAAEAAISRRVLIASGSVLMPVVVSLLAPTPAAAKSIDKDKGEKKKK